MISSTLIKEVLPGNGLNNKGCLLYFPVKQTALYYV